ncbi:RNA pyrophosphohydrolase [Kordiimonas pumila]|uniref:RNA pyrophosphohydrolase n=1 Tax=Kordiimonas pumila TaxID=2161677 RepID=A0ABV7D6A0_9PROT|nr:RNA pyrophosphohydrolase [Kordiimonas pumila]
MAPSSLPYRPCVGIMLINAHGLIFTAERLDMPGAWQMPQGGIDKGEDPKTAALRELEEEISVPEHAVMVLKEAPDWVSYDLPDHLIGKVWGGKFRGQKQKWFLMQLTGSESHIKIETEHPEFSRWKWSTHQELVTEIVPFKRTVYEKVLKGLLPEIPTEQSESC